MAEPLARRLAADLLSIGAVTLRPDDPFTWASGLRSPIYCDNRLTMAYPAVRESIASGFADLLAQEALAPAVIVGTATAGIPHAAWLAARTGLPMAYVRAQAKAHGKTNRIEGRLDAGQPVVVVEDLVSTGGSSVGVVEALREAGAAVLAVLAVFTYGLPAAEAAFRDAELPLHALTDYDTLVDVAAERGTLPAGARDTLRAWRRDPTAWSDAIGTEART